jgi:hypothetical protein
MALAPEGTLARRVQSRRVDDICLKMKTCLHPEPAVARHVPRSVVCHYVCRECGAIRRTYVYEPGKWVLVRREP